MKKLFELHNESLTEGDIEVITHFLRDWAGETPSVLDSDHVKSFIGDSRNPEQAILENADTEVIFYEDESGDRLYSWHEPIGEYDWKIYGEEEVLRSAIPGHVIYHESDLDALL
jgi:hypothetical protein